MRFQIGSERGFNIDFMSIYTKARHVLNLAAIRVGHAPLSVTDSVTAPNYHVGAYLHVQSVRKHLVSCGLYPESSIDSNWIVGDIFGYLYDHISIAQAVARIKRDGLGPAFADGRYKTHFELENSAAKQIVREADAAGYRMIEPKLKWANKHLLDCRYGTDFRSVLWCGEQFTFTQAQAACVRILWENWENMTPAVGEQTILEAVGSAGSRLRDIFKGSMAWGRMIVKAPRSKDAFQLKEFPFPRKKPT